MIVNGHWFIDIETSAAVAFDIPLHTGVEYHLIARLQVETSKRFRHSEPEMLTDRLAACVTHIDQEDSFFCLPTPPDLLSETFDGALKRCPDVLTCC
jgi:hypothetical protein